MQTLIHEETTAAVTATDPATAAATTTDTTVATTTATAEGSLLEGVTPAAEGDTAKPFGERVPEKYRVMGADGTLDLAATAEKIEAARASLETKLGKGASVEVPAKPEDYKLEAPKGADGKPIEGIDFEGFMADPLMTDFKGKAHAKGLSNEQLQFVVNEYLAIAPQLMQADAALSLDEAKQELQKVWTDEATMQRNLAGVVKAINGFGAEAADVPGSRSRLMEKYGRDPDFIAFAAKVAGEMAEDRLPSQPVVGGEADIDALMKSKAYWDPNDPAHAQTVAKVNEFHTRKYGVKQR